MWSVLEQPSNDTAGFGFPGLAATSPPDNDRACHHKPEKTQSRHTIDNRLETVVSRSIRYCSNKLTHDYHVQNPT